MCFRRVKLAFERNKTMTVVFFVAMGLFVLTAIFAVITLVPSGSSIPWARNELSAGLWLAVSAGALFITGMVLLIVIVKDTRDYSKSRVKLQEESPASALSLAELSEKRTEEKAD